MNFKEKKIDSKLIYDGKILKLNKDDVILPNGKKAIREVINHVGGSAVLIVKDSKVLLVKQFRYPTGEELLEIPAGKRDKGEEPIDTAKRELIEEAGLKAKKLELIFTMYPTPAYDTETIYIFEASGFTKSKQKLDEDEFLSVKWYSLKSAEKLLKKGKIKDGKTQIALLYALNKYGKEGQKK